MVITKSDLEVTRRMAAEFQRLTRDGDFEDFAVVNRYFELSAKLSLLVPALVDEIERLRAGAPAESAQFLKMDSQRGLA